MTKEDPSYYQSQIQVEKSQKDEISDYFLNAGASSVAEKEHDKNSVNLIITHQNKSLVLDIERSAIVIPLENSLQYNWLNNYEGFYLGNSIYIHPSHLELPQSLKKGCSIIQINPKDAFGDGRHPTTKLCAKLIEEFLKNNSIENCCDVGTGTGLLSIISEKFGVKNIDAFDNCKNAIKNTTENILLNKCKHINCFQGDIETFSTPKKYDLVVANLLTEVIENNISSLVNLLSSSGTLIVSGIGKQWKTCIEDLFKTNKLLINNQKIENNWLAYQLSVKY
ncbi:hypothetical protein DID80_04455 [Candidatus Marinamargulisbacteria bacterium SCGC AAA071-K20]|nr:hypothetical protein DID80_04455 [Candidatus Marinamargulisbacteria bacterium SCGC AAA071-K20]